MSQGRLCLATPGSSGLGHEAEEGMRREGGSPVTARRGFPVLSLTPSLQSWECSGVSGETSLSQPSRVPPWHPTLPPGSRTEGCPGLLLMLAWSAPALWSPLALSQVLQTLIWALGSRPPGITGQSVDPPTSPADTRMNHVGMGVPTALPRPLSFQAGRNVVRMGGNPCAGEGADRLGAGEALPPGWS